MGMHGTQGGMMSQGMNAGGMNVGVNQGGMAGINHNAGQMGQGGQTMNSTFGVAAPVHGMNAPMNSGMNAMGPGMNQPGMNHGHPLGKGLPRKEVHAEASVWKSR